MLLAISTPHLDSDFKYSLFGTYKVRSCSTSLMNGTREVRVQAQMRMNHSDVKQSTRHS
jgi:hypothetical protein